jgi:acid phosphatase
MSLLCGYETVIRGSSPFCSLSVLTPNEWLGFEYTNDIMYHYNLGYGSPVSGAIGFPWLNATNNINGTMPTNTINHRRAWKSSNILSFLTNIAIEKMECDSFGYESGGYWRVLVNDSPQPLDRCSDGPGESCAAGDLGKWLRGRAETVGKYGAVCQVNYSNSTGVLGIYSS